MRVFAASHETVVSTGKLLFYFNITHAIFGVVTYFLALVIAFTDVWARLLAYYFLVIRVSWMTIEIACMPTTSSNIT
jgi:uncharacterized membrane-anchored protein YitT (DUF2179 family)